MKRTRELKRELRKTRNRLPVVYIIVEGERTEKKYFDHFKRRNCNVQVLTISSEFKASNVLVSRVDRTLGQDEFVPELGDALWCVFDRDDNTNEQLEKARIEAQKNGYQIAFSNPCFELWFLLHFKEQVTEIALSSDAVKMLRHKELLPEYSKSLDVFEQLRPNMDLAIQRADRLKSRVEEDGIQILSRESNPVTTVQDLIRYLNSRTK